MKSSPQIREVIGVLTERGLTLGFAESCTGGLLSAQFTMEPGVSRVFRGSIVSYERSVKVSLLSVPLSLIQVMGEVSIPVAAAMARGAKESLDVDWAVAITGIAGPGGGTLEKPVGTVCFSVRGPAVDFSEKVSFDSNLDRCAIQELSAAHAVNLLCRFLIPLNSN